MQTLPPYVLWVFDPDTSEVLIEDNRDHHPAQKVDHGDLGRLVTHPSKVNGYAYRIHQGWRITDHEHKPVTDKHIFKQVTRFLRKKYS